MEGTGNYRMTRYKFLIGFFAAVSASAQMIVTVCAPVFGKMPKPCVGQCPACGLSNGPVRLNDAVERGDIIKPDAMRGETAYGPDGNPVTPSVLRECSHCRNAFWQECEIK